MHALLLSILEKLFPVQRHEWPKALMLLSVATLLGVGFTVSRAASEALFLVHFGVDYLPYLLLANPVLVLVSSTVYGAYADRVADDRLMIYTSLLPVPLILVLRLLMASGLEWVYFMLYTFVLAYATILTTSWTVYLAGHYDVQEAKRLLPFISSGILIGTVAGGLGAALCVPVLGAANILFLWVGVLLAGVGLVYGVTRKYAAMDTKARKTKRAAPKPSLRQSIAEGIAYSRSSALFTTTAIASIATMMALQIIDFEYSKIIKAAFPDSAKLTAFLGIFDGLTTILALLLQWFVVPWCLRRVGVQGTNLLFPYVMLGAFGAIAGALGWPALALPAAMFARFTRSSLMPTLRGTTRTLMLNAVPRKTGALVRSFNTAMVMPLGQGAGALLLVLLKGAALPWLFPMLGGLITLLFVWYSYKQNRAYGEALLDLLKEDRIHLLDLEDDDIRRLDATAVAAIGVRLQSEQEEIILPAIALLQAIGSPAARAMLLEHVPFATPAATAAALHALAAMGGNDTQDILAPYLDAPQAALRMAALAGLRQLGGTTLRARVAALLDDPDVQVRAAALVIVLAEPQGPEYARAYAAWEAMFNDPDHLTQMAALAILAEVPETPLQGRVYHALDHPQLSVRHTALRVLRQLALAGRLTALDSALLRALEADDTESRDLALQVLAALGTEEALEHMLVLLDDEQPQVRETLLLAVKRYGKRAAAPLFQRLQDPQASLLAKEMALLALARLDGVRAEQFLSFWEGALRDVYRYKLLLASLENSEPLEADALLRAALENAHRQMLSLLVQVLAVWTSPEVARLVESGLHDTDRRKRASALEALESLGERRFTRLFLPILEAGDSQQDDWREVAARQWDLHTVELASLLGTCLQDTNKWVVIGALRAGQARATLLGEAWQQQVAEVAKSSTLPEVRTALQSTPERATPGTAEELSLADTMLFLKRIPLYSSMTLEQLHTIASSLTVRTMVPGEPIFREGDQSYELYLIVSGQVEVVKRFGEITRTIAQLQAGDFFGDMAIFEDRPRSADVVATAAGTLLVLSPEDFRQIIMQDPAISFEIFRALSARLRRFDEEAMALARQA
ncbi:MAG: cyclic nucleotide-binding domain-containing protein [Candidatus Tectimicrobiota bacterium]